MNTNTSDKQTKQTKQTLFLYCNKVCPETQFCTYKPCKNSRFDNLKRHWQSKHKTVDLAKLVQYRAKLTGNFSDNKEIMEAKTYLAKAKEAKKQIRKLTNQRYLDIETIKHLNIMVKNLKLLTSDFKKHTQKLMDKIKKLQDLETDDEEETEEEGETDDETDEEEGLVINEFYKK